MQCQSLNFLDYYFRLKIDTQSSALDYTRAHHYKIFDASQSALHINVPALDEASNLFLTSHSLHQRDSIDLNQKTASMFPSSKKDRCLKNWVDYYLIE